MSYFLYFVVLGFLYLMTLFIFWSISFIVLSKFFKRLCSLYVFSFVVPVLLMMYLGLLLENKILMDGDTRMWIPFLILYLFVFMVFLRATLFKKLPGPIIRQKFPENTKYWVLRTGSKIAYWFYEARGTKKDTPIVFVHGGAGAHTRNIDREFFRRFTEQGYDVYLYDQAGGGFSEYLKITEYSMSRFIEDLEEIRKQIKTSKMILIGQSFGARICSYYVSTHKDNVQSIIFAGPGGLKPSTIKGNIRDTKELKALNIEFASEESEKFKPSFREIIRFSFSIIMCKIGGETIVSQFVDQKEITEYATRMIPEAIGRAYHIKYAHLVPRITSGGINVFVNVLMGNDYNKISSTMIKKLQTNDVPVLILRSAYDYVHWSHTRYYKDVFKNHYLIYISESGHIAWSVNKKDTFNSIVSFINGNTSDLVCYSGDQNPLLER